MAVAVADLVKANGKRVVLHVVQEDGTLQEIEGKIEAASEAGIAFKPKGKSSLDLLEPNKIEELQVAPEKPKAVTRKKLKPIELGQARQHLADRHGISMEWLKNNTEEAAFAYHEQLDHADLGHKHEATEQAAPTERDEALAENTDTESEGAA